MTEKMIAYCGQVCTECPAYIATQNNDKKALEETAAKWREMFDPSITAENILCDGCQSDGRKIGHCSECEVRACAIEHGVANCAYCDDYGCGTLTALLDNAPEIKASLEAIRKTL